MQPFKGPAAAVALRTLAAATLLASPAAFGQTARHDQAHFDYENGHYGQAFARFADLADEGHCDAARVVQLMWRYGRVLYGTEFTEATERLARWRRLSACPVVLAGANDASKGR